MEVILTSRKDTAVIKTGYCPSIKKFITVYSNNKKQMKLEEFDKLENLVQTHDFWCKIVGIISQPVNIEATVQQAQKCIS